MNRFGAWLNRFLTRFAAWWTHWLAEARRPRRRIRRLRKRRPIHSTRADAKRKAHAYAMSVTGRDLSWKSARRLLARWGREAKTINEDMQEAG